MKKNAIWTAIVAIVVAVLVALWVIFCAKPTEPEKTLKYDRSHRPSQF